MVICTVCLNEMFKWYIRTYTAVIFTFIIVSHVHEYWYRLAVLKTNPRSRLNSGGTWRSNNSLITSYSWLTTPNAVCFECVLAVHIETTHPVWLLWSGVSRGIVEEDRKIRDIATGDRVSHKSNISREQQEGRE